MRFDFHRIAGSVIHCAGIAALIGAGAAIATAQNVPAEYVVTGANAEKLHDFTTINLATAEKLTLACEAEAAALNRQISMIVIDNDGNHVYMDRMDGQGYINIITADMKAQTALKLRGPSKPLLNSSIEDPPRELQYIQLGEFANSGGLPIIISKQMIGVIGVGGTPAAPPAFSDEICGHRAMTKVFGAQNAPPLGPDLPERPVTNPKPLPTPKFAVANPPKSSLPAEWVVSPAAAAKVYDANQISLAAAKKISKVCRDWAISKGGGMAIYILDPEGEFVHMERTDGMAYNNIRTALMKAQTSLKTRMPTSVLNASLRNTPSTVPRYVTWMNLFQNPGGMPIVVDGQMIGVLGVGGGAGTGGDEQCAIEGLKATFGDHVTLPVYPAQ